MSNWFIEAISDSIPDAIGAFIGILGTLMIVYFQLKVERRKAAKNLKNDEKVNSQFFAILLKSTMETVVKQIKYFNEYAEKYRLDPKTKKKTFAVVQAEDELSAIGMVMGASWMGARAMTTTSGPGISLMGEFTGFGYFAEVPAVIWDIQRVGPSTGLPTRTSQGDVLFAAFLSHGDTKNICLYPGSVEECFEFAGAAFDLAERFQTPVFVLSDLDIGMNFYMADPFPYLTKACDR